MAEPRPKFRWRAWLRAVHRDVGYLAIGFTLIYAVSGIVQNHIEDWGELSFKPLTRTRTVEAIAPGLSDADAIARTAALAGLGAPTASLRAGDEIRLEYADGAKVTAIGDQLTIQTRERRAFIGVANWLHTARGKKAWKYIADAYAVFLLYLAISGIFMIKGKLGLAWRGATLISAGIAIPVLYVTLSGGPSRKSSGRDRTTQVASPSPQQPSPAQPPSVQSPSVQSPSLQPSSPQAGNAILTPLPPDSE